MAEHAVVDLNREFRTPRSRADPGPVYAKLRQQGAVLHARTMFGKGFVLPRYAEVSSVIKDPRFASDRRNVPGALSLDPGWLPSVLRLLASSMVLKDPPDHRRLRNLVQKAFTPTMIESLSGRISQITDELLDAAAAKPVVDLIADFAVPLPLTVIAEMLGVPAPDRLAFRRLLSQQPSTLGLVSLVRSYPSMVRLNRLLRRLVALRRRQPGDDLISRIVQAEADGDRLSEDEIVSMVFLLLFAGHETTVNLIGNGVLELLRSPGQLRLLREQPALIDRAIEELLRFTNPVGFVAPRFAKEDVELAGVAVPQGSLVTLLIGSANLDEAAFPNADRLDITREGNRHLAFGYGTHYCLGAPLARMEARIAIPALLKRFGRLELAVPEETLRWREGIALRGLEALPLRVAT